MRRPNAKGEGGIYDPNMTPLIDVSLVLVVILLVATPMALQSSITVSKTGTSASNSKEKARVERLEITVVSPDTVIVNRERMARADMRPVVGKFLEESATRQVAVRCKNGVTHGTFVGVLDELKGAGAMQIAVQGR